MAAAEIDVSLEWSSVGVVDGGGKIVAEGAISATHCADPVRKCASLNTVAVECGRRN